MNNLIYQPTPLLSILRLMAKVLKEDLKSRIKDFAS